MLTTETSWEELQKLTLEEEQVGSLYGFSLLRQNTQRMQFKEERGYLGSKLQGMGSKHVRDGMAAEAGDGWSQNTYSKEAEGMDTCAPLIFSFLFSLGPQPMVRCS